MRGLLAPEHQNFDPNAWLTIRLTSIPPVDEEIHAGEATFRPKLDSDPQLQRFLSTTIQVVDCMSVALCLNFRNTWSRKTMSFSARRECA
jgi:hypothetical protein